MPKPSGDIYLCANAIVSYSHTIDFKTPEEQQTYWGSLVKYAIPKNSYVRKQRTYVSVEQPLDKVKDINYLFYRAEENAKLYYCYVTSKEYVNDDVTHIYFEIDVLQTYLFDYKVHPSYILQEHVDRWDANHKPIYSRTDEGLDYGDEYTLESAYKVKADNQIRWYLAVCKNLDSNVSDNVSYTSFYGLSNPYVFLLIPGEDTGVIKTITKSHASGVELKESALQDMQFFTSMMSKGLGTYVQQIVKIPYLPFDFKYRAGDNGEVVIDTTAEENVYFDSVKLLIKEDDIVSQSGYFLKIQSIAANYDYTKKLAEMGVFEGIESAMPTDEQWAEVIANPYTTERDKRFESKLLTYPYRYNLLTDWRGQPQVIKNEYIGGDKIKLHFTQGISFNSTSRYWLSDYRKDAEGRANSILQLVPEECPIITDEYYSYLLANKNQILANHTNAMLSDAKNMVYNIVGNATQGNFIGAGASFFTGTADLLDNQGMMFRSENAKRKDLKNIPDTIVNSNDGSFNVMDNNEYITFYRYKICCEFEELLADTFATTGYTIKRLRVPNTKSRVRYNYVKTSGANITGSFDQNDLAIIKAIYDNGITFWHYNTINFKPLDYSLENIETKLIKGN